MPSSRQTIPRRRSRAVPRVGRAGTPLVGVISGIGLIISVFLPWYATNLGPPFSATSASGWESTNVARVALVAGVLLASASLMLMLEEQGALRIDRSVGDALVWVVLVVAILAALAVGFRLVIMPEPAEFLSRQVGIFIAAACAVGGILAGLAAIATRD
jgi:hypothetical protein